MMTFAMFPFGGYAQADQTLPEVSTSVDFLHILQNPTDKDYIDIIIKEKSIESLELYNILGQNVSGRLTIIHHEQSLEIRMSTEKLPGGVYILSARIREKNDTQRIIKE